MSLPCESKFRYKNRKEAARAASRLRAAIIKSNDGISEPIEFYKCNDHHCYHLGHRQGWRREVGLPRRPIRKALPL